MGGNRCRFRDCNVSTLNCPGIHFFRFPIKEPERFQKWLTFSGNQGIFRLPPESNVNRVVCGRHFRDECFMNYKKDRITKTALPTIWRLSKDVAIDYEQDIENGVFIDLDPPSALHLIPPADFKCPLNLSETCNLLNKRKLIKMKEVSNNYKYSLPPKKAGDSGSVNKKFKKADIKADSGLHVLEEIVLCEATEIKDASETIYSLQENEGLSADEETVNYEYEVHDYDNDIQFIVPTNKQTEEDPIIQTHPASKLEAELLKLRMENENLKKQLLELKNEKDKQDQKLKTTQDALKDKEQLTVQRDQYAKKCKILKQELESIQDFTRESQNQWSDMGSELSETKNLLSEAQNENVKLHQKVEEKDVLMQSLKNRYDDLEKLRTDIQTRHNDLLKEHEQLRHQYDKIPQVTGVITLNASQSFISNSASLTKPQIFNAIKRYLSATMVSLVRMEMFGSSEREWKPDERAVAVDILQLGESIYNYFTEEWRFRLPALREVRSWLEGKTFSNELEEEL
uniref:THAP-type domain-containing protein n=1 Tax=Glossina pallidipes TaxID=7398 RepID=A0A1B0A6C6_GLOPL